jgi:peroxiredoxin
VQLRNSARQNAVWRAGRRFSPLFLVVAALLVLGLVAGCRKEGPKPETVTPTGENVTPSAEQVAKVGAPAPDFELPDLDGKRVKLSDLRGKIVVLEWFNPECPFVKASHTKGSLVDTAKRQTASGVVWLAVNSNAAGKQGAGAEKNREGKERFALTHPILLDETGQVGKRYDAKRTPHMYVIDTKGTLVYRGAIDNSPDGEGESPKDGKLVNYVDTALADLGAGRPVATAETEAYGCSVKYAN